MSTRVTPERVTQGAIRPAAPSLGPILAAGWAALVVLHLWLARGVTGPIVSQDESGYLGNARWLAGLSPVPDMDREPIYAWGYSLLIAPLAAVFDDPALLYRAVQVLNALLLASLLPLLWVVLRKVGGVEPRRAALAAAVGSLFPSTLVHSSVAWAESLLPVLVALFVLAVWAALTERRDWQRMWPVPVAVAAFASHPRFLPALVLTVVGVIAAGASNRMPRRPVVVNVVAGAVGFAVVRAVGAAITEARWPDRIIDEGSVVRLLTRLLTPTRWPGIVGGSIGQAWYLAVASLGLVVVGVVAAAVWARRGSGLADPRRVTAAFVVVVFAALFITSVVSFVGTAIRVDHLIYGRYNEPWAPLFVAVAVVALLGAPARDRLRLLGGSAAMVAVLAVVLVVGRGPGTFDGAVVWNNVLGLRLAYEIADHLGMVVVATLGTVVVLLALLAVTRLAPRPAHVWACGAVALLMLVMGVVAVRPLADFSRSRYDGWELPDQLDRVAEAAGVDAVGFQRGEVGLMGVFGYQYWLPDLTFRFTDVWRLDEPPELVVARVDSALEAQGAAIVALDARNDQAVWVLPGTDAYRRLAGAGALLPPGFPSLVAPESQRALVHLVALDGEAGGEARVAAGGSLEATVAVTHDGSGQAWPSDVEWPMPGVVRVAARWYDGSGTLVRSDDRAPLPWPMWPGDRADATIELRAVDGDGRPLPPGRYTVGIDLVQAHLGWFADEGTERLRLEVEVTAP